MNKNQKRQKTLVIAVLLSLMVGLSYCTSDHSESHHLSDRIKHETHEVEYAELNDFIDTAELLAVDAALSDVQNFHILERATNITSFPCSSCHTEDLDKLKASAEGKKKAHWDIKLQHASSEIMNCATCHNESHLDDLTSLTGTSININASYKLCGQCHSKQLNDWYGGAHGKQLNGWKPPRVAQTCVGCHNPHKPAFEQRFPARYNTHQSEEQE